MQANYSVYQDIHAGERQSDEVEFCLFSADPNGPIYFYCSEFLVYWTHIVDAGNLSKALAKRRTVYPATLSQICRLGLIGYIQGIKQYWSASHLVDLRYCI